MLLETDGKKGLNFYSDFEILNAVYERYGEKYNKQLYSNLLRSEHIPFNLFIPLKFDLNYAKQVFNKLLNNIITEIIDIKVEYAPEPAERYLNDRTSFDTYISYKHTDNQIRVLGIEVKYTEQAYPLKKNSKEEKDVNNPNSKYWEITKNARIFKSGVEKKLIQNDFRQIWRNQLLGESIKQIDEISHFTSLILYPSDNTHFTKTLPKYLDFLNDSTVLKGFTFENYISALSEFSGNSRFKKWISYLKDRYLIK